MKETTITSAEWEVMRVVWSNEPLTSREIIDILQPITNWKEGTIKSLTNRLIQKGYLTTINTRRPFQYKSTLSSHEATVDYLNTVLKLQCSKLHGQLLADVITTLPLSQQDCQQLISLLVQKQDTAPSELACHCPKGQCTCHSPHSS